MRTQMQALKVKVKSLAVEATIIRLEERKALAGANWCRKNNKPECQVANFGTFVSLRQHRVSDVRREQRSTLLAYAFLRGRKYKQVEPVVRPGRLFLPDWDRVVVIVNKFGNLPYQVKRVCSRQMLLAWAEGSLDSHPSVNPFAKPEKVK